MGKMIPTGFNDDAMILQVMRTGMRSLILLLVFVVAAGTATADDKPSPVPANAQAENAPGNEQNRLTEAERRKKASAAMAAVAGIAIIGIVVIAFIMIWARRLRRLARDLGPAQTTLGNDFWFLKPPKAVGIESEPDGKSAASETPE